MNWAIQLQSIWVKLQRRNCEYTGGCTGGYPDCKSLTKFMLSKERHEEQRWKHLPFPKQLGSPPGLQTGFAGGSVLLLTQEMDVHTSPISIEGRCLLNFPTR